MSRVSAGEVLTNVSMRQDVADELEASVLAGEPANTTAQRMNGTIPDSASPSKRMTVSEFGRKAVAALRARWYLRQAQSLGPRTRVWGRPSIQIWGNMHVGDRVQFVSTIAQLEVVVGSNATLEIGDGVFINYGTSISANRFVSIGARSKLGTHVLLMDNDFHCLDPDRRLERPESAPIILEENVWLAARVIVLRGVTIGENSVVGAGSVVTKDIPPNVFAAGVPAKVIKSL